MNSATSTASFICKTPGVCGGRACIRHTRLAVWGLEEMRRLGFSDQRILEGYPDSLTPEDLRVAWQYVADYKAEIDEDIRQNHEDV